MQRFRKRTRSLLLKDDSSTTELLPVQAESASYDADPLKEGQDTVEEQLHKGKLVIKGWPGSASSLGNRGWEKAGLLALDSAIALIPLLFIGKSGSVRGTRTSPFKYPCSLVDNDSLEHRSNMFVGLAYRNPRR